MQIQSKDTFYIFKAEMRHMVTAVKLARRCVAQDSLRETRSDDVPLESRMSRCRKSISRQATNSALK